MRRRLNFIGKMVISTALFISFFRVFPEQHVDFNFIGHHVVMDAVEVRLKQRLPAILDSPRRHPRLFKRSRLSASTLVMLSWVVQVGYDDPLYGQTSDANYSEPSRLPHCCGPHCVVHSGMF